MRSIRLFAPSGLYESGGDRVDADPSWSYLVGQAFAVGGECGFRGGVAEGCLEQWHVPLDGGDVHDGA
jgi:hypothetical protein